MQSIVITGTSTGIGHASTKALIARGFRVFGSVRKQADADRLKTEFGANYIPLIFDVTDEAAVHAAAREVRAALNGETLKGLVNNAGIAVAGPALEMSSDDFRKQIDINVIGPFVATQAFAPLLGADRSLKGTPGRIVMISSVAGKHGNPLLSPYSTSKHAIEGFSESLRRELMLYGIGVIIIGPGAVKTNIWDKVDEIDISRYDNSEYRPALEKLRAYARQLGEKGLPSEQLGELVHHVLTAPEPRVRYQVTPEPGRMFMARFLPRKIMDRLIGKQLGLLPKQS
ncbi:MAG: SDR family NAD(P)-dependent oxidoreductase [Pseudomonadota bacterium]